MIRWVLAAGLTAIASVASADGFYVLPSPDNEPATGLFECEILDARAVGDGGTQDHGDAGTEWFWETYRLFTFDASTGLFSTKKETHQWVVLRPGNSSWDLIANLPGDDPVYNLLRIETWNTPIKFSLTDGGDHFSGLCESAN